MEYTCICMHHLLMQHAAGHTLRKCASCRLNVKLVHVDLTTSGTSVNSVSALSTLRRVFHGCTFGQLKQTFHRVHVPSIHPMLLWAIFIQEVRYSHIKTINYYAYSCILQTNSYSRDVLFICYASIASSPSCKSSSSFSFSCNFSSDHLSVSIV